ESDTVCPPRSPGGSSRCVRSPSAVAREAFSEPPPRSTMAANPPELPPSSPATPQDTEPTVEELLRAIIESSPLATMAFDREQRLVLWNSGAERLFGWSAEEVLGGPVPDGMIPGRERGSSQARIQRTLGGAAVH